MAERGSTRMNTERSSRVGITFSMPAMTIWARGRVCERSPLPSLVKITEEPVSAIRKLAPVSPTSAPRNCSRSTARASAMISLPSESERSAGLSVWALRKASVHCSVATWIAGATIWLGDSPRSWRMYSPRSVSTARTPFSARNSLRPISSETMDLPLAMVFAPRRRQMARIAWRASSAVAHQWTSPPAARQFSSNRSR